MTKKMKKSSGDEHNEERPRPELSSEDKGHLIEVERKFLLVRDYAASVATGRTTGFYVYGRGGCGKTFNIVAELGRRRVPFKRANSRMTGRALFDFLAEFPDSIILLEDMEHLFLDPHAQGVLRSALWASGSPKGGRGKRLVTWKTSKKEEHVFFSGGLIMTGNRPLPSLSELEAVKTRITCFQLVVSDNELIALMRKVALEGFRDGQEVMDPAECVEIVEYIIEQSRGLPRSLDMRLLSKSYQHYLQWRDCDSGCHWRDLVATEITERPIGLEEAKPHTDRAIQLQHELDVAREIRGITDTEERRKIWHQRTGKSQATLYRRLDQLKKTDINVRM